MVIFVHQRLRNISHHINLYIPRRRITVLPSVLNLAVLSSTGMGISPPIIPNIVVFSVFEITGAQQYFRLLNLIFMITDSADPDEMPHLIWVYTVCKCPI